MTSQRDSVESSQRDRALAAHLEQARWFGGKGRSFAVTGVRELAFADPVTVLLVTVTYEPSGSDTYQVPVACYPDEQHALRHALVGRWQHAGAEVWAYDALQDHDAVARWLAGFAAGTTTGDLRFARVGDPEAGRDDLPFDPHARGTLLSAEQSNSSVAFGDSSLMKLFRRVTPGRNPDIEILTALTEAGSAHVAALYGYVEAAASAGPAGDEPLQLGILQQFLVTASDGFELALASLRNLLGDPDATAPERSGGDFAAEAQRLGAAVAELHETLAGAFGTTTWRRDELGRLAGAMAGRLADALTVVPELAAHAPALRRSFAVVGDLDRPVVTHRVHGDLHLGQTLRTVKNWKIIDFEGEPAKPLPERRRPDSPWRDVAGMLRSFDYAARMAARDQDGADSEGAVAAVAQAWSDRNCDAFLAGYRAAAGGSADTGAERLLLDAYLADKAVYEAVYEARNRPGWLPIPLAALARLAEDRTTARTGAVRSEEERG